MSIKSSKTSNLGEPSRLEGGGVSKLRQRISQIGYNKDVDIELGTVLTPLPNLTVQVDADQKLVLTTDDLIVAERLTRHKRIATLSHSEGADRDLGDGKATDSSSDAYDQSWDHRYIELTFEDVLKPGDRVILASINEGQTFVVVDRAVTY
ncbi:DUF2577 domain-containing protein [Brevibacillus daliensis]|uniref:DUF2577 domain-containing protein n=1 Tax=Brevibacillus daliensis TaxID=2892995 RepID=UPI001E61EC8D|nr:DUF2577 domain-containing protein [Brevibacillus daliensis]